MKEELYPSPESSRANDPLAFDPMAALNAPIRYWIRVRNPGLLAAPAKPAHSPPSDEKNFISAEEVAGLLNIGVRTVWRHRQAGKIPPPIFIGGLTKWRRLDIEDWIRDQKSGAVRPRDSRHPNKQKG